MKEINIAAMLINKRKEKGITQDDLAAYIGVSKAAVSKWETDQSYPDITFLPQIAAYFNISVDDLIGYQPQMSKAQIKQVYFELADKFSTQPFDEVLAECRSLIKQYYSCFPLLLQMAGLLLNHAMLASEPTEQEQVQQTALELCRRIKNESHDACLARDAVAVESACYMLMNQPQEILNLFGEEIKPFTQDNECVAQAYQMLGNLPKAQEATQICMYQHLLSFLGLTPQYLMQNAANPERFEEILSRSLSVADTFKVAKLHPNVMSQIYLAAAQTYAMAGKNEQALTMLQKFTHLATTDFFPFTLHGDEYFDLLDNWFSEFSLGSGAPRSEEGIKHSLLQCLVANPAFAALTELPRFQQLVTQLKTGLGLA